MNVYPYELSVQLQNVKCIVCVLIIKVTNFSEYGKNRFIVFRKICLLAVVGVCEIKNKHTVIELKLWMRK